VVSPSLSRKILGRYLWSFENLATGSVVLKHAVGANEVTEVVVGELRNHATRRSGSRVFRTSLEAPSEVEKKTALICLTFMCPCIPNIIVNDDQQDAIILAYLFMPNQFHMFRGMSLPIIRST